ncbi:hypothetical protein TBLA_0D04380 [Henningerozyma blattae CBS 6284]|uniref:Phosphatase n=1 Tax=Henningerozyma blattae (strain ATCC 34711 / CBS 6284 / DSM 70876 / NBRC 10599 / NRRL Y-10934 / UCD 77-7) TaxID=1071380 RepID=I2H3I2_HENB6|nr:hypothetical protein TBLA_0D04380 [Tetrapisispora blattae CBS 6284]CCH60934.1 hypothetical protein TBLA_0D04380 [Tetrapisispora blattae CBS 6284]
MVKAVIFSDFDGTITLQDSNDFLVDNKGMGKNDRLKLFEGVLNGTKNFRDIFSDMLGSLNLTQEEGIEFLKENIELDPGFKKTFLWAQENNVPLIVVSSGTVPVIRALLTKMIGSDIEKLDIVSNDLEVNESNHWTVLYRDSTPHGHDKSKTIDDYKSKYESQLVEGEERPVYFYCGDGISDLTAAKECDLLFAKAGKDLITFCKKQNVPYHEFNTWDDILRSMKAVLNGEKTVKELMEN